MRNPALEKLREKFRRSLIEALKEAKWKSPPRWELYNDDWGTRGVDWRLWDSVEALDIVYAEINRLRKKATARRIRRFRRELSRLAGLLDQALMLLDPWNWKPPSRHFRTMTEDPLALRKIRQLLDEAFKLFDGIYPEVVVAIDVEAREGCVVVITPLVWRYLRDAIYGIEQYLAHLEAAKKAA